MSEWTVVTVIIALVGLLAAVVKPIINLNTTLTTLTASVNALQKNMEDWTERNSETHARLWKANEKQDGVLDDHEKRITRVEEKTK